VGPRPPARGGKEGTDVQHGGTHRPASGSGRFRVVSSFFPFLLPLLKHWVSFGLGGWVGKLRTPSYTVPQFPLGVLLHPGPCVTQRLWRGLGSGAAGYPGGFSLSAVAWSQTCAYGDIPRAGTRGSGGLPWGGGLRWGRSWLFAAAPTHRAHLGLGGLILLRYPLLPQTNRPGRGLC